MDTRGFQDAMRRAPGAVVAEMRNGLGQVHDRFFADMKRAFRGKGKKSRGPTLRPQIVRTIANEVAGTTLNDLKSISFTTHIAAYIQEHGGTITANGRYSVCGKGKMLAIPLDTVKTKAGFARAGPCDDASLFLIRSKKGNILLVKRTGRGKNAKITPQYLLKRSVTIPPGLGFFATFRKSINDNAPRIMRAALGRALRVAGVSR